MRRCLTSFFSYLNPVHTSIRHTFTRSFSSTLPSWNLNEQDQFLEHLEAISQAQDVSTAKKSELVSSASDSVVKPRFDWRPFSSSKVRKHNSKPDEKRPFLRRVRPDPGENTFDDGFFKVIKEYKEKFETLLTHEEAILEEVVARRLANWSLEKLEEQGYCLTGMHGFWLEQTKFGRPIASFFLGPGLILPNHLFKKGTQVIISRIHPLRESDVIKGVLFSHTPTHLNVCFDDRFDVREGVWRLDVGLSSTPFQRMREAIEQLQYDPNSHEIDPRNKEINRQVSLRGTFLRDVILKSFRRDEASQGDEDSQNALVALPLNLDIFSRPEKSGIFGGDMRIFSWIRRHSLKEPIKIDGDPDMSGLDKTQVQAIALMLGERISLVQGPPGTGKTKTITRAIKLLKSDFEVAHPVMVCTYTNVAVDNLVDGLLAAGLKPLRCGSMESTRSSLEEHTLDYKFVRHRLKPAYDEVVEKLKMTWSDILDARRHLAEQSKVESDSRQHRLKIESMKGRLANLQQRRARLKVQECFLQMEIARDIILDSDVVCTTCLSSSSWFLSMVDFPVVFLDEASMSTEPASLIPLMRGCKQLALIGDHKQLPPVITSDQAKRGGLSLSLFERLTKEGNVPSIMLDTQYRMHPDISEFPSQEFYKREVLDGTIDPSGKVFPSLHPPASSHLDKVPDGKHGPKSVIFLDHRGPEALHNRSRVNHTEAFIICTVIQDLLQNNPDLRGEHIGIIAPYVSQVSLLTRLLNRNDFVMSRFVGSLGGERAAEVANIEVKTVDGFEGREKEIILFSTVRNNPEGYIGFLADKRRLNVGLTRAKRALYVIGNMETLKKGKHYKHDYDADVDSQPTSDWAGTTVWQRYATYLNKHNLVITLQGNMLDNFLYPQGYREPDPDPLQY